MELRALFDIVARPTFCFAVGQGTIIVVVDGRFAGLWDAYWEACFVEGAFRWATVAWRAVNGIVGCFWIVFVRLDDWDFFYWYGAGNIHGALAREAYHYFGS